MQARAWGRATAVLAAVVILDQATKALVRGSVGRGERDNVFLGVDIVNVRNRGVAFGLIGGGGTIVAILVGAALALLILYFATHTGRPLLWLPTGLLLGGALGNLIDRLAHDAVTDFIDLPLWPAFNLADVAITLGVLSLLYVLEEGDREPARA